jgi:hypothetical protein
MNKDNLTFSVFATLLNTLGRDFVTEDVIRDTKKVVAELFPDAD